MTPSPLPVVVVGGGIAGIACARALEAAGVPVRVLDRGATPGGRMAVRDTGGRPVDIGASYLTVRDPGFAAVVDDWAARGLVRSWTDTFHVSDGSGLSGTTTGPVRMAGVQGMRSLVHDLAAGLDVVAGAEVRHVEPTRDGAAWLVHVDGSAEPHAAAAVVLAMPEPQAAPLLVADLSRDLDTRTPPVTWEPVVAVSARWDVPWWPAVDGVFVNDERPDAVLGWVADDGRRRGDGAAVLVAHSTPEAARGWLHEPDRALGPVLAAVGAAMGVDGRVPEPLWTHVHRWTYARPERDRPAPPFALLAPGLGLCGDAWGEQSRVEGAWSSGHRLGTEMASLVAGTSTGSVVSSLVD